MPVKIKRSQRKLIALTISERAKPWFFRFVNKFIKDEIIKSIETGRSPVKGKGSTRFEKYSISYINKMGKGDYKSKRRRPVNLTLSGDMLKSIKSRIFPNFIRVWFTDPKAKYHDKLGAGKSKVKRRMIPNPKNGEEFNAGLQRKIVNALEKAIKTAKK